MQLSSFVRPVLIELSQWANRGAFFRLRTRWTTKSRLRNRLPACPAWRGFALPLVKLKAAELAVGLVETTSIWTVHTTQAKSQARKGTAGMLIFFEFKA